MTAGRVDAAAIRAARDAVADVVRRTPVLDAPPLSERCGAPVVLKAESLQRTGSFKLRGALAKLAALGSDGRGGVVCGSAGNHAWALAAAARAREVRCEVYMPRHAPVAKVDGAQALGATVHLHGDTVEDCVLAARERAASAGLAFVHPFDDPDVVAGQGTLGLELLDELDDPACVVVPLGGGGLVSGIAIAMKSARPDVRVVGVQVAACASYPASLAAGRAVDVGGALTIADGIAVKRPGELTLGLVRDWVDEVVVVDEDETAEAMASLLDRTRLVVEGAGAVGVAALMTGRVAPPARGTTCVVLSGGNVDAGLLASVARRSEAQAGRRLDLVVRLPDRPGALAGLLDVVAAAGANLIEVSHVRDAADLHVRETAVRLVLETRGPNHAEAVRTAVAERGAHVVTSG